MQEDESPLKFPCEFPIKAMGRADGDFHNVVEGIARRHVPELEPEQLRTTPSRSGNYVSVTITITARSRDQLDALYMELNAHEAVLMTL